MIKSIQQFQAKGLKNLEKVFVNYSSDMTKFAEMVYGVKDNVLELGRSMIVEELEYYDEWLRKSSRRKVEWYIVRRDETTLLTSIGSITYHKTLFKNKLTGEMEYLLDYVMGLEKHARITEDAEAKLLEEAVESCYRKGGENVSINTEAVSKQTVKNKIHQLKFPKAEVAEERKVIPYLYIDADEDHVSLQYLESKGDIKKEHRGNTVMPKLVYVYEGITNEKGRKELINAKYFGGLYEGSTGNETLWKEVSDYIETYYDTEQIKKIYINGDGAGWIKSGVKYLVNGKFVLDKFHMHKYINIATTHLLDSAEDARSEIYNTLYKKKKYLAEKSFDKILSVTEEETKRKAVETSKTYILSNWSGIMEQIENKELECSAEGHVSHIYADRMSSRPLGWSKTGVDKMARLCVYKANKGDILELVRYQKTELKMVVGLETPGMSAACIMDQERRRKRELGDLADIPLYSIPYPQIQKIANFKNHIWGL